jgi:flagellar FliL protein
MAVTTTILPGAAGTVEGGGEAPKKSKKKLIIIGVVLLVLLGAGAFVGKGMLAGPSVATPDPKTVAGDVVTLAPITMNLADGRYLKLTLSLQRSKFASPPADSVDAAAGAVPSLDGSKALDASIAVLGQRTYAQLLAPGGRAKAEALLSAKVRKLYPDDVLGVYFTEFLMQ